MVARGGLAGARASHSESIGTLSETVMGAELPATRGRLKSPHADIRATLSCKLEVTTRAYSDRSNERKGPNEMCTGCGRT